MVDPPPSLAEKKDLAVPVLAVPVLMNCNCPHECLPLLIAFSGLGRRRRLMRVVVVVVVVIA